MRRRLARYPVLCEIALVVVLALLGVCIAAAVTLAPWHAAEASVLVVDIRSPR